MESFSSILTKIRHFLSYYFDLFTPTPNITSINSSKIKTFVFIDLETTGLPHMEHNTTKITELCAAAIQADHLEIGFFPRVQNKLSLCFNPTKYIKRETTRITGLTNELLEGQSSFSKEVVELLQKWLDLNEKPICLVAHNGYRFDYPVLRAEIANAGGWLSGDVMCIDSLSAFQRIDKNLKGSDSQQFSGSQEIQSLDEKNDKDSSRKFVSYKLADVYSRLTSKEAVCVHEAEGDVFMLVSCACAYGSSFVNYGNENAKKFSDMPIMRPQVKYRHNSTL